jgi:hypothetical protein
MGVTTSASKKLPMRDTAYSGAHQQHEQNQHALSRTGENPSFKPMVVRSIPSGSPLPKAIEGPLHTTFCVLV